MASRRDELNAYSFARKRTVASFLKPLPNGSVDSAPRPVRTVLPTIVLGTLILVGFGACGLIKPAAPQGWDNPGQKVIVGDQSTTRYVVLQSGEGDRKRKLLYPILNLASAKLLLDPDKFEVVKVKESVLDDGGIPHGPTIGIPYAPDRLPDAEDAGKKKTWALCERPGRTESAKTQKAVFVFSEGDKNRKKLVRGKYKLTERSSMFVQDREGAQYLVDHRGVAHRLDATYAAAAAGQTVPEAQKRSADELLRRILFGQSTPPQQVTDDWLDTLVKSPLPIFLPPLEGAGGASSAQGVPREHRTVGKVLEANGEHYVVLADRLAPVSDFVAELLLEGPVGREAYPGGNPEAIQVGHASILPEGPGFMAEIDGRNVPWPTGKTTRANTFEAEDGNKVVCSVFYGGDKEVAGQSAGVPDMSMWAGGDYPAPIADGGASAYVTPGSGLLYKQVTGKAKDGSLFLVTDTGLRYSVPVNNDSDSSSGNAEQEQNKAQIRLGYGSISSPPLVPKVWSQLLSAGPSLNTQAARQPQGS